MNQHDAHSLSREFQEIENLCNEGVMNLARIMNHVRGRGEALLTLFLAGPFLLPLPLPGLSVPFGILIALIGLSLWTRWEPWLPESWLQRPIPHDLVRRFCQTAQKVLRRSERFIRPRMIWMRKNPILKAAAGVMITLCGILLALPLPPGTNAPPAAAIVCLSVALLEGDGVLMLVGYLLFGLNAVLFTLLPIFGYEAIIKILGLGF